MGYDIECIIDIHTYPGEYFCPVCRTLVFPNEAIQAQCTHLYCKPCLSHIANGTRACPYDNYLVTESDSKPLVESDKVLAENIGKVKVHCLFFRSGCTWQGTVSECNSHCSGCSFGNSAVICNKCGIQIVHRQVHEHAQTCAGGSEPQQAAATGSSTTGSMTTTQTAAAPTTQTAGAPQNTQNTNQQGNVNPQPAVVMPTPEQWYQQQQQQYQQYYQQYPGFQPYQQPTQQYYPPQQYQQQPVPVQAQTQSDVHSQPANQIPSHSQTHIVPQTPEQHYFQTQAQPLIPSHTQTQVQVPPPQVAPTQVSHPNYQVNQQLPHPSTRPPHGQTVPPQPHGVASTQQPAPQHVQAPQYHHHQAHIQQPQMHSQALNQPPQRPQPSNQPHMQVQQQAQPYRPPPQPSQANVPAPLPQIPHPQAPPVSGHHSYQQPQPTQPMMHQMVPHASTGSVNPVPVRGHVPQQPPMMYPPPHGSLPQQVPAVVQMQTQAPPPQNQQFPTHAQQPPHPFQLGPAMQPTQQTVPQQYAQQQPFRGPFPGQSHESGHYSHQPMQPRPPYQTQQFQHPPNNMSRHMGPNPGVYQQTIPQSGGGEGLVPHSGPVQQTSIDQNKAESTRLERNTMEQAPNDKGFEQVSVKKESTLGQYGTAESGAHATIGGLPSVKQEEHRSLEQTSGMKSSEVGMQGGKFHEGESDLSKSSNFQRHDINQDKVLPTESDKQFHITASNSITNANGLRSKSHASTPPRPQAHFSASSPSMLGPHGPGSREPGFVGPPFEYHSYSKGPRFEGPNGGSVPESSMLGWDEKRKTFGREHLDTLPSNHPSVGLHSRMGNFAPSPEFDMRHKKPFGVGNADREYPGISQGGFDGSSSLPGRNSFAESNGREAFHDGRFPSSFGDHMAPRPFINHSRRDDFFGHEGPAHFMRQEFGRESFNGTRNGYSIPHAANFAGGGDSFDLSRKRKPMSAGWCRICRIDCESVEGLDGHSQTREHQNMAMDMVKMIKQQNKMRQLASGGHSSQGGGKIRKVGVNYHGNRP